jgi:competence protein ComEC
MKLSLVFLSITFTFFLRGNDFKAHFINVGQADATLIEFSKGAVMIDAGGERGAIQESRDSLNRYLTAFYTRRADLKKTIDVLILTHNHYDHIELITDLSKNYRIKRIIATRFEITEDITDAAKNEGIAIEYMDYRRMDSLMPNGFDVNIASLVKAGEIVPKLVLYSGDVDVKTKQTINQVTFTPSPFRNENNNSIVCKLTYGKASMLFTGDLEEKGIQYLLAKYHGHLALFDTDVYHVGHHGAENGTTQELLNVVTPKIAVISAGSQSHSNRGSAWDHGHPRTETIEMLEKEVSMKKRNTTATVKAYKEQEVPPETMQLNKEIYCTCWGGSVIMSVSDTGEYKIF